MAAWLALVASCSNTPATTTATITAATTAAPAPIQIMIPKFETTWALADDVEQVTVLARTELVRLGGSALVSISVTPEADQGHPNCAERKAGGGGWENGKSVEVRSVPGCMFTNTAGLSFIEWDNADRWYHVETFVQPGDAISWLADWKRLP